MSSFGHYLRLATDDERDYWARQREFYDDDDRWARYYACHTKNCSEYATHVTGYHYVTGRAGRVSSSEKHHCEAHAKRFADKYGLEMPTEQALALLSELEQAERRAKAGDAAHERMYAAEARLAQAERERDELGPLFIRDCCRILGVDEKDTLRMDKIAARLAKADKLAEALREIIALPVPRSVEAIEIADAALADWSEDGLIPSPLVVEPQSRKAAE